MMFEFAYKHCQFEFLLKVDDDNYVNVPNIFRLVDGLVAKTGVYLGRLLYARIRLCNDYRGEGVGS